MYSLARGVIAQSLQLRRRQTQNIDWNDEEHEHEQQISSEDEYSYPSVSITSTISPIQKKTQSTTRFSFLKKFVSTSTRTSSCSSNGTKDNNGAVIERNLDSDPENFTNNTTAATASTRKHIPFLFHLAKCWKWEPLIHRCQTHPQEIYDSRDENGDNALHWCVFGKAPVEVVLALLQLDSSLANETNYTHGNLPIHSACSYRAGYEVLQVLLDAYPESAGISNFSGSYPIHILCDYGCSIESFQVLLSCHHAVPTLQAKCELYQRCPIMLLNSRKNLYEHHIYLNQLRSLRQNEQLDGFHDNIQQVQQLQSLIDEIENHIHWQKCCLLLLVEYTQEPLPRYSTTSSNKHPIQQDQRIVFACITNPRCPISIKETAIYLYREKLLQTDDDGNTPLHIVATIASSNSVEDGINDDDGDDDGDNNNNVKQTSSTFYRRKKNNNTRMTPTVPKINNNNNESNENNNVITEIVSVCPEAAFVRNHNGQLPLCCFLQCTIPTKTTENTRRSTTPPYSSSSPPPRYCTYALETLIHANPSALQELNLQSDTYIYVWSMLLSSSSSSSSYTSSMTRSTIYQTLIQNPSFFCCS